MKINQLKPHPKSKKTRKRVGRGSGSGLGRTCGRGMKGQKSRSGVSINGFEGGQMPLYRRLPKRGFKNFRIKNIAMVNLSKIQRIFENKKVIPNNKVNLLSLQKLKLVNKKYKKLKLLGSGDIREKFDAEVNFISNSAKSKIEKLGGKIILIK